MFNLCFPDSITSTDNHFNLLRNSGGIVGGFSNMVRQPILTQQPLTNDFSNSSSTLYELGKEFKKELEKETNLIKKYVDDNNMNHQYFVNSIYNFIIFEMWNIQGLSLANIKEQINDYLIHQNINEKYIIELFIEINNINKNTNFQTLTDLNSVKKDLQNINKQVIEKLSNEVYHFIVFKYKHLTKLKNQEIEIDNLESKIKELESVIKKQKKELKSIDKLTVSNSLLEKQVEELKWILNEIMETDTTKKPEFMFHYTKSVNYNPSQENKEMEIDNDDLKLLSSSSSSSSSLNQDESGMINID